MTREELAACLQVQQHIVCRRCDRPVRVRRFVERGRYVELVLECHRKELVDTVALADIRDHRRLTVFDDALVGARIDRHGRHRGVPSQPTLRVRYPTVSTSD